MRIGIDAHNLEGNRTGVGRYAWNLLKEWSKLSRSDLETSGVRPHEIKFFLYFKNEIPLDVGDLARNQEWDIRRLNVGSNVFFKHWAFPRAIKKDNIDVLFCPDYVLPFYAGRPTSHIKTAVTIHDIIYEARPNEYSWPSFIDKVLLKWASKRSAKYADVIFVPSEFTKDEILKYYKVDTKKIIVTPLAPDPIFKKLNFSDGNIRREWEEIKKEYNIHNNFIFFIGSIFNRRFLPQKIEAFENFVKPNSNSQFLIVGDNHTKPFQNIQGMIDAVNGRLGRNAIIWKRYINDDKKLVYLYNKAYLTLWLSSYEGFGLPVLESMACGTPVVTCKYGSLPEVAGGAAVYVDDPSKPKEIEDVLVCFMKDKDKHKKFTDKGLGHIKKFSWEKTAKHTLDNLI